MATYSFRAECLVDVARAVLLLSETDPTSRFCRVETHWDDGFPDVEFEMQSTLEREALAERLGQIEDGHVMVETLRPCPLAENPLERTYTDRDLPEPHDGPRRA